MMHDGNLFKMLLEINHSVGLKHTPKPKELSQDCQCIRYVLSICADPYFAGRIMC